jgi:hypothetical protein
MRPGSRSTCEDEDDDENGRAAAVVVAAALAAVAAVTEAAEPVPPAVAAAEFISVSGERRLVGAASPRRDDMSEKERTRAVQGDAKVACRCAGG